MISKRFIEKFDPAIQVEFVSSPDEAQRLLRERSFDCVVSDYQMPTMDGIELAIKIRETSDIPFIIYTGRGSEEVAEAAFEAGIDDYIRKEFEHSHYQVLVKRIRSTVEKHRAEKELRRSEASLAEAQRIAHLGNWDWNIVTNQLFWSDEIYRI
ncbi:MAG: response regulator, partial [Candidatus Bathyarchaeia archaeon]